MKNSSYFYVKGFTMQPSVICINAMPIFVKKFLSESTVGNSKAIRNVRQIIHKLAQAPSTTVLLMGARGSGKNIADRVIHYSSMPAEAPFVEINCAARTQL
jgi:DNA-binding NtrC family response regulator